MSADSPSPKLVLCILDGVEIELLQTTPFIRVKREQPFALTHFFPHLFPGALDQLARQARLDLGQARQELFQRRARRLEGGLVDRPVRRRQGGPVDKTEWAMTPQTVNAYYNPPLNEIVFPAGILQPPFFDMNAEPAVNYGAIGAVIGHEIGHGFDDAGSTFAGDGVLRNWWTDEDRAEFEKRTEKRGGQ